MARGPRLGGFILPGGFRDARDVRRRPLSGLHRLIELRSQGFYGIILK